MNINISPCTITDLNKLHRLGYKTFDETFRSMNNQKTIDTYLQETFNKEKLSAELKNKDCHFYFLHVENELAGYLKLNKASAQTDINDNESIEIERIYIMKAHKRKGLGKILIHYTLQKAAEMKKNHVWLGVWEKNVDAISFYTKMGFYEAGRHSFRMGDEMQNDLILKKDLNLELFKI